MLPPPPLVFICLFSILSLNEPFTLCTFFQLDNLQTTLEKVRRDTETEISKLRDELTEKNRMLERLQSQLKEQTDYEALKRQCQ